MSTIHRPKLRGHQSENKISLSDAVARGLDPLLVAPCGYGKGTLCTDIVADAVEGGYRVMFVVRGVSLVDDMSQRVTRLGIPHGVLCGGFKRSIHHPVQVASIDTLFRMQQLPRVDLFIVDEADQAIAPTFAGTLNRYPNARTVGMTATPIRLDGRGLGKKSGGLFDVMVLGPPEHELIRQGYLVGSHVIGVDMPEGTDAAVRKKDQNKIAAIVDQKKLVGDIVQHYQKHAAGRKTAAFGVNIAHANHITERFNEAGIPWAYVDADTSPEARRLIYRDLDREDGTLMGVSSVGCTSVGWDHPIVSCLIAGRPTDSLRLWRQQLGRGSRTHPGKTHFLVLDHSGNTQRHDPWGFFEDECAWSLDGKALKAPGEGDIRPPVLVKCKQAYVDPKTGKTWWPCFRDFRLPANGICPYCGCPLGEREERKVVTVAGELKELKRKGKTAAPMNLWEGLPEEPLPVVMPAKAKENYWHKMINVGRSIGKQKGYKENWAVHWATQQYGRKYGELPPADWVSGARVVVVESGGLFEWMKWDSIEKSR